MSDLESRLRATLHDETTTVSARPTLGEDMVERGSATRRRRRVAGAAACLVLLAAVVPIWRGIDTSATRIQPARPTPVTHSPSTPDPSTPALPAFATVPVDVASALGPTARVVNLRTGRHATYDRIVVDLTGGFPGPGYHVGYARALVGPSGKAVHLPGKSFLTVGLSPAAAHTDAGTSLLSERGVLTYDYPTLRGSALVEDFEGRVTFGLALSRHAAFRAFELTSPSRLVIDVRH